MSKQFDWQPRDGGFHCEMPGNVTLVVTPDRYAKGFTPKAARGTLWRAQASLWDGNYTLSRFGRDEYGNLQPSASEAKRLAESIYLDAVIQIKGV
jgi:hypothetical protein